METLTLKVPAKKFSSWTYGEARTGSGQLIEFTCPCDLKEKVQNFFLENIKDIELPTTGVFNMTHGSYGRYTRYDMKQHKYAGGRSGFIEVLEIKNPPDKRCPFVVYEYKTRGNSAFTEWKTLKDAEDAFEKHWGSRDNEVNFPKLSGFKRYVQCNALTPWFYAIGDEELINDYALPYGLEDDPVYRIGRKFVVVDEEEVPHIKTCMGTRFILSGKHNNNMYGDERPQQAYRIVSWDDGSIWEEKSNKVKPPRELMDDETWIVEAMKQFQNLLAGKSTEFIINFTDRHKFIGKVVENDKKLTSPAGDYLLTVTFIDKRRKAVEGWVNDFKPTKKNPDIIQHVRNKMKEKGRDVKDVVVKKIKSKKGGNKWMGVFYDR